MDEVNEVTIRTTEVGGCVLRRVMQLKGMDATDPKDYHSELGTTVHAVAKHLISDFYQGNEIGDIDSYIDTTVDEEEGFDVDFVAQNKPVITERLRRLMLVLNLLPEMNIMVDQQSIDLEFEVVVDEVIDDGTLVHIKGVPDIISEDFVVDLKSGKTRSKKHAWQVAGYDMLKGRAGDKPFRTGVVIYLGEDVDVKRLKNGKLKCNAVRVIDPFDMAQYQAEWHKEAYEYATLLRNVLKDDIIPDPEPCSSCFFCEFRTYCGMAGAVPKE